MESFYLPEGGEIPGKAEAWDLEARVGWSLQLSPGNVHLSASSEQSRATK